MLKLRVKMARNGFRRNKHFQEKKRRLYRTKLFLATGFLSLILLLVVNLLVTGAKNKTFFSFLFEGFKKGEPKRVFSEKKQDGKITFLIIGLGKKSSSRQASGFILAVYDSKNREVNGISFDPDTLVEIPGYGFEKISESLIPGVPISIATVSNLVGVKIKHYLILDYADFKVLKGKTLKTPSSFSKIFDKAKETDFSQRKKVEFREKIKSLERSDVNVIPLPVRSVTIGKGIYYRPKEVEVNRLIQVLWELSPEVWQKRLRVMVFNGSGVPGAAGDVSLKLIAEGFKIISTKNADRFDYNETIIIIYDGDGKNLAREIKKIIKVGKITLQRETQEIADILIVVGKDYKKKEGWYSGF